MSPTEWWWEFDSKFATQKRVEDMQAKSSGRPSAAAWDRARAIHAEKMKKRADG